MATIKSFTDLSQSKTLSKILPHESVDMMWKKELKYRICSDEHKVSESDFIYYPIFKEEKIIMSNFDIPCWSLAALLDVLPLPQLSKDKTYTEKVGWTVCVCPNHCRYVSSWHNNPVDACYEMILKLHELKML